MIEGSEPMKIKVEVKNEILGNSTFWKGPKEDINKIRNNVARMLAQKVIKDGKPRNSGMWFVSVDGSA